MAVVHYVVKETMLPGGEKMIRGNLALGAYATGGADLNLANFLKSTEEPTVWVSPTHNVTTHMCLANVHNAEYIKVVCVACGADTDGYAETNNSAPLGINCAFIAVGQAY
jgi:hypothetical protein